MANPLPFKPPPVDPRTELNRRLEAAPTEHAEALLVVWDILQAAHDQGTLDAVHGLVTARDTIFAQLSEYAKQPEGIALLRNLLGLGAVLGSLDPEPISKLSRELREAMESHRRQTKAPSLLQLFKGLFKPEVRRGLSFLTLALGALGRATE